MSYRLHCFAQSGNAYKAALMLTLSGQQWEPVWVDFFSGAARSPDFLALNEMGEVPVLEDGDTRLTQSGVILDYLSTKTGKFAPRSADERREVLRWLFWDNHKLTANLATWRFMTNFLPEEKRSEPVIAFLSGRARTALKILNSHLDGRDWIAADVPTIADLSCVGYLYYRDELAIDWDALPNVLAWTDRLASIPDWAHPYELMPGHPLGTGAPGT